MPYRSPDGTYEVLLKSFLEDASLTDAEFRVAAHLATKPDGWELIPKAVAAALDGETRWTEAKVRRALTGLRERGYLTVTQVRNADGTFGEYRASLCRDRTHYGKETAGQNRYAESGAPAASCEDSASPQVRTATQFTADRQNAQHRESTDLASDYGSSSEKIPHDSASADAPADRAELSPSALEKPGSEAGDEWGDLFKDDDPSAAWTPPSLTIAGYNRRQAAAEGDNQAAATHADFAALDGGTAPAEGSTDHEAGSG
jgi:hypothetical protein